MNYDYYQIIETSNLVLLRTAGKWAIVNSPKYEILIRNKDVSVIRDHTSHWDDLISDNTLELQLKSVYEIRIVCIIK